MQSVELVTLDSLQHKRNVTNAVDFKRSERIKSLGQHINVTIGLEEEHGLRPVELDLRSGHFGISDAQLFRIFLRIDAGSEALMDDLHALGRRLQARSRLAQRAARLVSSGELEIDLLAQVGAARTEALAQALEWVRALRNQRARTRHVQVGYAVPRLDHGIPRAAEGRRCRLWNGDRCRYFPQIARVIRL